MIQRDRHAYFIAALATLVSGLEKIALEIRHLQRTEVREASEYFAKGQKGSSSMPHKKNPVTSEQICGLARVVRANAHAALENNALWHGNAIFRIPRWSGSASSPIPPSWPITCSTGRQISSSDKMFVYPERMRHNLDLTRGLVFSGQLLLDLAAGGMLREEAYAIVQRHAMEAWENESDFRAAIAGRSGHFLPAQPGTARRKPSRSNARLKHVDAIFARVFNRD